MADSLTKEQRSYCMSRIKSRGTYPEIKLKKFLRGSGFSYQPKIKGNPDFAHKTRKIAILMDGCFWHGCPKCYREPKSNKDYWIPKIKNNRKRDKIKRKLLKNNGWEVIRVWSHELKNSIPNKIISLTT